MSIHDRFERYADKKFRDAALRYLAEYQGKDKSRAQQSLDAVEPYIDDLRLIDVDDEAMQKFKEDRKEGVGDVFGCSGHCGLLGTCCSLCIPDNACQLFGERLIFDPCRHQNSTY